MITEILFDPHDGLSDNDAEWFELHNQTARTVGLDGCVVADAGGGQTAIARLTIPANGYVVFARSADPALNGGLDPDATFSFALNNGGDTIELRCGATLVDRVAYGPGFPLAQRVALSLDPASTDAAANDDGANWCLAVDVYVREPAPHLGTPGLPNPGCPVADACGQNPCDAPPAPTCDGNDRIVFQGPGDCSVIDGDAVDCSYPRQVTRCPAGQICAGGDCVAAVPNPVAGEVIFTEVMYDPHTPLDDAGAEWFELTNVGDRMLTLDGCVVEDAGGNLVDVVGTEAPPGAPLLFARSANPVVNGGLDPDHLFTFALNNGAETLTLRCGAIEVDAIGWDEAGGWPDALRASLALDPASHDAAANDDPAAWCLGGEVYFPGGAPVEAHRGTPGAPNPPCPVFDACAPNPCLDPPVPACDGPTPVTFAPEGQCAEVGGAPECAYPEQRGACGPGTVCQVGACVPAGSVCDPNPCSTPPAATCDGDFVIAPAPLGQCVEAAGAPACTYPTTRQACPADQTCAAGACVDRPDPCAPNPCLQPPPAVCDGDAVVRYSGPGACADDQGASDCSYPTTTTPCGAGQTCRGGACVPLPNPCLPNPCDAPPGDRCDGDTVVAFGAVGQCANVGGAAACTYVEERQGCGAGRTCEGGGCVDLPDPCLPNPCNAAPGARCDGDNVVTPRSPGQCRTVGGDPTCTYPESSVACAPGEACAAAICEPRIDVCNPNPCGAPPGDACDGDTALRYPAQGACAEVGGAPTCDYVAQRTDCEPDERCAAGRCEFVGSPCDPNPCNAPPAATCDGDAAVTYPAVGACAEVGGAPACTYDPTRSACEAAFVCAAGVCQPGGGAPAPQAGQVLVTEVLYDPQDPLSENTAEWVELTNVSAGPLTLTGCELHDGAGPGTGLTLADLVLAPGGVALFARSLDPAVNGGLHPVQAFTFGLNNPGDTVALRCGGAVIDAITYDDGGAFPDARADSISRDPTVAGRWCLGRGRYFDPAGEAGDHFGSPGQPNPPCAEAVDFCRLQQEQVSGAPRTVATLHGRLYERGLTDRSRGNDPAPFVRGELGYGPDNSQPDGNAAWSWVTGTPNPGWDGPNAGEADNDEYQGNLTLPAQAGHYDLAWRFTVDGGVTWTYCDSGAPGSSDGYALANAGDLSVVVPADPCQPNPCGAAPAPACDGNTAVQSTAPGMCATVGGAASCTYPQQRTDCGADQRCVGGACAPVGDPCDPNPCNAAPAPVCDGDTVVASSAPGMCAAVAGAPSCSYPQQRTDCGPAEQCANGRCDPLPDACDPNPCDAPPAARCDGNVAVTYPPEGGCEDIGGAPACSYAEQRQDCGAAAQCGAGACQPIGPRLPQAGEVVIDEIMYDPHGALTDANAEWIEIHNRSAEALTLSGCSLGDGVQAPLQIANLQMPPGAFTVFARSRDVALNGGLVNVHDQVFTFGLANGGDTVRLTCNGVVVSTVTYDDGPGFPDALFASIALDPAAEDAPGVGANWCLGRSPYFDPAGSADDHYGTPGAANPPCDEAVDYCALQFPIDAELEPGGELTVYGRIFEMGATDRTDRTDPAPAIRGELGVGPDGSDPASAAGWRWAAGAPNAGYQGVGFPDAGNDEYQATLIAPGEGDHDFAWRFTVDGGRTWTYCDGAPAGSSDGYVPNDAGQLAVMAAAGACDPNPCVLPPDDDCQDATTVGTYRAPGVCAEVGGAPTCEYAVMPINCAAGQVCLDAECVAPAVVPQAGEVIISEILYDPHDELIDANAEWFELANVSGGARDLNGCTVTDAGGGQVALTQSVGAGGFLLFARSANPAVNGELAVDGTFGFDLNNNGDTLILRCNNIEIDRVTYDVGATFPAAQKASISLSAGATDAVANDQGANWCLGTDPYFNGGPHRGTPGEANPDCPRVVGFCRLQFPEDAQGAPGASVRFFGRVFVAGVTDRSAAVDLDPSIVAQWGYGPDGGDPAAGVNWNWRPAVANPLWNGGAVGEPNNDEYLIDQALPRVGTYDFAWRFSADRGTTWTYCDRGAGSSAGYAAADAGSLTVEAAGGDVCDPNPCVMGPAPDCADATHARVYAPIGTCAAVGGAPQCTYDANVQACQAGEVCAGGQCVDPGQPPVAGELFFTEIMYDPHDAVDDAHGEWFEIYNSAPGGRDLAGCVVSEGGGQQVQLQGSILAGGVWFAARNADPVQNGGLMPDQTFNFDLANTGETLTLVCGGQLIDAVTYDVGGTFPAARRKSLSLAPLRYDATANDEGGSWCLAPAVYFASPLGDQYGSPGALNPPCPVAVDLCRLQVPPSATISTRDMLSSDGRVLQAGITDRSTLVDPDPALRGQLGIGPDGSNPEGNAAWAWTEGNGNFNYDGAGTPDADLDEYRAAASPPVAPGRYDYAWRFTVDQGATWTYCDRDGSQNGYAVGQAGDLLVELAPDPCQPNPCDEPPPANCAPDGVTVRTFQAVGQCLDAAGVAQCTYAAGPSTDCSDSGRICADGACTVPGVAPNQAGQVIVSEVMYDPHFTLADSFAEYVELHNTTGQVLDLDGCILTDEVGSAFALTISNLSMGPDGYALFAASADAMTNGGLMNVHQAFEFALNNNGDSVILLCDGLQIDRVVYDDGGAFPDAQARSISLDPTHLDEQENDLGANWCLASTVYYHDPVAAFGDNYGSPGTANPACPVLDTDVDYCVFVRPASVQAAPGDFFSVFARIREIGVTDLTPGVDFSADLLVDVGYGPDGSDPDGNFNWVWAQAFGSFGWDGAMAGVPDEDEYEGALNAPFAGGDFDLSFRVSLDRGNTYTYCDLTGSDDGFDPADTASLDVMVDACFPNPCFMPPDPICDGDFAVRYEFQGACTDVGGMPQCEYPEQFRQDCTEFGGVCSSDPLFGAFCDFP